MTTDLEKKFFVTFGIEPKLNNPCEQLLQNKYCNENSGSRDTYFDPFPYCVGFENCTKDYKARVWVYPKITDRILLELICILTKRFDYADQNWLTKCENAEALKVAVLRLLLLCTSEQIETYKHQVQALFKEG